MAIAMKVYRIISAHPDEYASIFINVGFFLVEMTYFHAVGKVIEDSGICKIIVDGEVIASDSFYVFVLATRYNRCKCIHPLMYLSIHKLLLQFFCDERKNGLSAESKHAFIRHQQTRETMDPKPCFDDEIYNILLEYENFEGEVFRAFKGKIAQYYAIYLRLIEY